MYEQIGQLTVEKDWLKKNLLSLPIDKKREIIENDKADLSVVKQCKLIGLNRSSYYAQPKSLKLKDYEIMHKIDEIFTDHPYFDARRMQQELRDAGYDIGRKKVRRYYRIMGIEAIYLINANSGLIRNC